ncbi:periplasmic binding protein [Pyrobaculum islandicum DSM 4184]|uniref:Periplasmic binding protein n=1 Tax=Pyrobaculum islandicum (strain DSM 4184 / JCM 9189 / GEO3) TaxID=384616 RepID=A1RR26_PYRIL|nr:ABC transporter substrate-binding protein [Pyrobaculum islandicum]ABL87408.1 periplasmic binding protein [Pyrobaculum islandicum DSM 4184]
MKWKIISLLVVILAAIAAVYLLLPKGPSPAQTAPTAAVSPTASPTAVATQPPTQTPAVSRQIVVVDFRGKRIVLPKPPERIVVLNSYWAEVLVALGAGDKIVGIGRYVDADEYLPPEVRKKPVVGDLFGGVNVEAVVALKPDVVVTDYGYGKADEVIKRLEEAGVPVVALFMRGTPDELKAVEVLGNLTGAVDKARELKAFMAKRFEELGAGAAKIKERKRAVLIFGSSILAGGPLSLAANSSFGMALVEAGAVNVALEQFPNQAWPKIDMETLMRWDPDVVLIAASAEDAGRIFDKIRSDERWRVLKAYKNGEIYLVPWGSKIGDILNWGPRGVVGREYIAEVLYPDVYAFDWRGDLKRLGDMYGVSIPPQAYAVYNINWKEVVDLAGNVVKIPSRVERFATFVTYQLPIAFNVTSRLVAVGRDAVQGVFAPLMKAAFPAVVNLPTPGDRFKVNVEALVQLKPQVVFNWVVNPDDIRTMQRANLTLVQVVVNNFTDAERLVWLYGVVFDRLPRARQIVNDMEDIVKFVANRTASVREKARVLYLWVDPLTVAGGASLFSQNIELAGGVNVAAADYPTMSTVKVDPERILKWNPDVIIIAWQARYNESAVLNNPVYRGVNAVKNGRVYKKPILSEYTPDTALSVLWTATKLYPDLFRDVNFTKVADYYYRRWYGVSYTQVWG